MHIWCFYVYIIHFHFFIHFYCGLTCHRTQQWKCWLCDALYNLTSLMVNHPACRSLHFFSCYSSGVGPIGFNYWCSCTPQMLLALHLTRLWIWSRDPWLLSHQVRGDDMIYGDKLSISWTAAKYQCCLFFLSDSQPWLSVIALCLYT